jgi:hypothetical protein
MEPEEVELLQMQTRRFALLVFIFIVISAIQGFTFDYDSYKPTDMFTLMREAEEIATEHGELDKTYFYGKKHAVQYRWEPSDRVVPIDEQLESRINEALLVFGQLERLKGKYGYHLSMPFEDKTVHLVFQNVLVQYLEDEVQAGDAVIFYLILGSYATLDDSVLFFVNEFHVPR